MGGKEHQYRHNSELMSILSELEIKTGVIEGSKIRGRGLTHSGLPRRAAGGNVGRRF